MKLVLHALHENELPFINGGEHVTWAPDIPIWLSLGIIIRSIARGRSWALTGTPIENSVEDLVGIFEFVSPGASTRR